MVSLSTFQNFDSLVKNFFANHNEVQSRLMLLWLLPHFSRRVKGQHKKDTLDPSTVKQCGKMLLPLIEDALEPVIW